MDELLTTEACTLPTAERPLRLAEFDLLFSESARTVHRDGVGVRIQLVGSAGLRDRVEDLTEREASCCSFFTFAVAGEDDHLTLDISVPAERRGILEALADRAEELAGGRRG